MARVRVHVLCVSVHVHCLFVSVSVCLLCAIFFLAQSMPRHDGSMVEAGSCDLSLLVRVICILYFAHFVVPMGFFTMGVCIHVCVCVRVYVCV